MSTHRLAFLAFFWATELVTSLPGQAQDPPRAGKPPGLTIEILDSMRHLPGGIAALPPPPIPPGNPQTQAKIELGRMLFFDKGLSLDHSISCATCHDPEKAYSDGRSKAVGLNHVTLNRRTPSLLNAAYNPLQFWDGRVHTLEEQALVPAVAKNEMGMQNSRALLDRLQSEPEYPRRFREVFGKEVNIQDAARAIAAFERTLITTDSAFDRYAGGDKHALTVQQKRGLILFIGKAACTECHNGPNFTDNKFHNLGLAPGRHEDADAGRFKVSKSSSDRHSFKTPSLRSSTQQSHFTHNGSFSSLAEIIEFYDDGGGPGADTALLFKLHLTDAEQQDLLAFLHSLEGTLPKDIYSATADKK